MILNEDPKSIVNSIIMQLNDKLVTLRNVLQYVGTAQTLRVEIHYGWIYKRKHSFRNFDQTVLINLIVGDTFNGIVI